jgi:hypothetical protein
MSQSLFADIFAMSCPLFVSPPLQERFSDPPEAAESRRHIDEDQAVKAQLAA